MLVEVAAVQLVQVAVAELAEAMVGGLVVDVAAVEVNALAPVRAAEKVAEEPMA